MKYVIFFLKYVFHVHMEVRLVNHWRTFGEIQIPSTYLCHINRLDDILY